MGLLDTLIGSFAGKADPSQQDPIAGALSTLLARNGGIQGLMSKFSQGGLGEVFSSWVGMGQNQPIDASQVRHVLGAEQIGGLASQLGVDPSTASRFLADHLPKIVDKLTPSGQVDPGADHEQGLAAMIPSLLQSLTSERQ